ncbi:hypothetical protein ACOSQ2_031460 [Xanthoceras sorbifolium]
MLKINPNCFAILIKSFGLHAPASLYQVCECTKSTIPMSFRHIFKTNVFIILQIYYVNFCPYLINFIDIPLLRNLINYIHAYDHDYAVEETIVKNIYINCNEMISKWDKLVCKDGSCELDVWPFLVTLRSDVISRTTFGSNFELGKRIFQLQTELAALAPCKLYSQFTSLDGGNSLYPSYFGFMLLLTKRNKRMKEINNEIQASLLSIIKNREIAMKAGKAAKDDLLGILMESNLREIKEHGVGITIQDVIGECNLFYFVGAETTSVLLVLTMILFSHHQDWQARAREEVFQLFGNHKPDFDGLNHLKVVMIALDQAIPKETKLRNLSLLARVQVILPILLVHHDQELWGDDAMEFKPERFSNEISKATKNQVSFFPFAWGHRICIGQNFALMEAKMALAIILLSFSFELSPSYVHAPHSVITLRPQHRAHLIIRKL